MMLLTASCDSRTLWEDEKYAVYWMDSPDNITLGIKIDDSSFIGRYGSPPMKVGSNEKYLVLEREGVFYYMDKALDDWRNDNGEGRYGPYTREQFLEYKLKLDLPEFEVEF